MRQGLIDILEIPRDRAWFQRSLPLLKACWDEIIVGRARLKNVVSVETDSPPKPKKRKKQTQDQLPCLIDSDDSDSDGEPWL